MSSTLTMTGWVQWVQEGQQQAPWTWMMTGAWTERMMCEAVLLVTPALCSKQQRHTAW